MVKKNFYKNIETGEIFKETSDNAKYLKVSPWKNGEDRRINIDDLKKLEVEGKVTKLPWDNAHEELNTIWNNTDRYWTHDDNEYKSLYVRGQRAPEGTSTLMERPKWVGEVSAGERLGRGGC